MESSFLSKMVWKRFVEEGVLDPSRLNGVITESWWRCKKAGVNPYGGNGSKILTAQALQCKREQNAVLLEVAIPYLETLYHSIRGTGIMVLLIDSEGYVLRGIGDEPIIDKAKEINLIEGVRWRERDVGTNAIGTALTIQEPMMLIGGEHFAMASQDWSCAACPIRDNDGILYGVIDVSGLEKIAHMHMLGIVVMTAYSIERELQNLQQSVQFELLEQAARFLNNRNVTRTVVTDINECIISVSWDIDHTGNQWFRKRLNAIRDEGYTILRKQPLYSFAENSTGNLIGYIVSVLCSDRPVHLSNTANKHFLFSGEIGTSDLFREVIVAAEQVAKTNAPVYISGESGTGKELIARAIHQNSLVADGPFVPVNCGAIPMNLVESELFGYVDGAFTGARKGGFKGKFQQAQRGTLFLDEVETMPQAMQVALLRVLQESEVTPIGGGKSVPVSFRLITASNRNLWNLVKKGDFREDLYYRIHVFPLHLPPLRERKSDIPQLVQYFGAEKKWFTSLSAQMMDRLLEYDWPGNVRELFNILEQIKIRSADAVPNLSHMPLLILNTLLQSERSMACETENDIGLLKEIEETMSYRDRIQKVRVMQALHDTNGNITKAAELLQMSRSTLYRTLHKFGL